MWLLLLLYCTVQTHDRSFSLSWHYWEIRGLRCDKIAVSLLQFPKECPQLRFQSLFHLSNGIPISRISTDYPYSPRWDASELVKRIKYSKSLSVCCVFVYPVFLKWSRFPLETCRALLPETLLQFKKNCELSRSTGWRNV